MMDKILIRNGKPSDFVAFYGQSAPRTMRLWVAEMGGAVVGLAGYYRLTNGYLWVFSDLKDELRDRRKAIVQMAIWLMERIDRPALCQASKKEDGAARLLERLGWSHKLSTDEGEVFEWLIH